MDYDKRIKGLITDEHYVSLLEQHGVMSLNELNENYLNSMLFELMRQTDGMK